MKKSIDDKMQYVDKKVKEVLIHTIGENFNNDPSLEAACKHGTIVNCIQNAFMKLEKPQFFTFREAEELIVKFYSEGLVIREK